MKKIINIITMVGGSLAAFTALDTMPSVVPAEYAALVVSVTIFLRAGLRLLGDYLDDKKLNNSFKLKDA